VKVCDKTCIFFFFPIINKYFLMAKRSLLSRCLLPVIFSQHVILNVFLLKHSKAGIAQLA